MINNTNQSPETVIADYHSRGYLPHIENKTLQVITFRLYDSVPREIIEKWRFALALQDNTTGDAVEGARAPFDAGEGANAFVDAVEGANAFVDAGEGANAFVDAGEGARAPFDAGEGARAPREERNAGVPARNHHEEQKKLRRLIDDYEDKGYGQCFFRDDRIAELMESTLFHYEGRYYHLVRWVIMPNHIHVLIELLPGVTLSTILQEWKSSTSHIANKLLGRNGVFWMPEYYDRYIRDQHHLKRAIEYIDNNPVKAGLADTPSSYRWSSAYHDAVEGSAGVLVRNSGNTTVDAGEGARAPFDAGEGARAPHDK